MVYRCLQAASAFPKRISVIDLRTVAPWDKEAVLTSLRATGKLLVVHEDTTTGGFGAETIAAMASAGFEYLDAPIERIGALDTPVPFNIDLTNAVLPSVEMIREKMENLLRY
jgi:2-oxoisovalerate dehydrogenase E1 component